MAYVFRRPSRRYLSRRRLALVGGPVTAALSSVAASKSVARNAASGKLPILATGRAIGVGENSASGKVPLQVTTERISANGRMMFNAAAALTARAKGSVQGGLDGFVGLLPLVVRGQSVGRGVIRTIGVVSIAARSSAAAIGRSAFSGSVPLLSKSVAISVGRAPGLFRAALGTLGAAIATARVAAIGKVSLAAQGVASATARTTIVTVQALALFARSAGSGIARAAGTFSLAISTSARTAGIGRNLFTGQVGLRATGMAAGMGRALGVFSTALRGSSASVAAGKLTGSFRAALQASALVMTRGSVAVTGKVSLAMRAGASSAMRAMLLTIPMVYLVAMSAVRGLGRSASTGALKLQFVGKSAASTTAQFSGAINLKAISAVRAIGRNAGTFKASLLAVTRSVGFGRLDGFIGKAALSARSAIMGSARAAMSVLIPGFVALLAFSRAVSKSTSGFIGYAKLSTAVRASGFSTVSTLVKAALVAAGISKGQAKAPVTGILTLTTASSVTGPGAAGPSLFAPLAALSTFCRSIATSFGLLSTPIPPPPPGTSIKEALGAPHELGSALRMGIDRISSKGD